MFDAYFDWLRKVNTILVWTYNIQTHQVWQEDWSFDWHRSWVAGCQPYEASNDAITELRDRGILEEIQAQTQSDDFCEPPTVGCEVI